MPRDYWKPGIIPLILIGERIPMTHAQKKWDQAERNRCRSKTRRRYNYWLRVCDKIERKFTREDAARVDAYFQELQSLN